MLKINVDDWQVIKEGKATILAPKEDKVFYNPIQQFNRDLSVMAIRTWSQLYREGKDGLRELKRRKLNDEGRYIRILEALSATGLRAIRYGHEIPGVQTVVANDLLKEAVKSIERNIDYNELGGVVRGNEGDAIKYMLSLDNSDKFHVVDLDPYGTAAPFIDGAIQSLKEDGLLLVTCTDAGVLAGSGYPEKCFALYGGNNFGNTYMGGEMNHEVGIRLIIGMIAREAAKYKKTVEPVLSLSIDFYFRIFLRVKTSPAAVKKLASNTMLTHHCSGCGDNINQPLGRVDGTKFQLPRLVPLGPGTKCSYCESYYNLAGPMWRDNIHNEEFVARLLELNADESQTPSDVYKTKERIRGMLTVAQSELRDQPFYFNLNQASSFMKTPPMPINDFARAVGNLGYDVSLTHAKKNCVKTNAPWATVLQINRAWLERSNKKQIEEYEQSLQREHSDKVAEKLAKLKENPQTNPNLTEGMVGYKIVKNVEMMEVDFDTDNDVSRRIAKLRKVKMVRYQENPTKNWGPKARPSS